MKKKTTRVERNMCLLKNVHSKKGYGKRFSEFLLTILSHYPPDKWCEVE